MYAVYPPVYNMSTTPDMSALHMSTPMSTPTTSPTQTPLTSPRRSRALPTDGPTVRFLYTIIKQLDLKSVDWTLIATDLGISNGHAARMRYSRFRQQMEGISPTPRQTQAKKVTKKPTKASPTKTESKREPGSPQPDNSLSQAPTKQEHSSHIKTEAHTQTTPSLEDIPLAGPSVMEPISHIGMMPSVGNFTLAAPQFREGLSFYPTNFSPGEPGFYTAMNTVTGPLGEQYDPRLLNHTVDWELYKPEPVTEANTTNTVVKEEHQQQGVKPESPKAAQETAQEVAQEAVSEGTQQEVKAVVIDD
ncbi:hypothetical protein BO94DRAFT_530825 [Aspergillus sclerotioniger CBS 115572]|uniref:Myb-like DNA-binding domain-containing protein n=1 Tax=Aspergillus sclerotioniger CBS 115572 TaxID=1450535 RepID=A0A317X8P6_9EURO|nr:hypothetical protein BO94DRAFT_530825 [Aspergillus sclerotioniger CBS 115572]PWY94929.1 hypothetical protein BO94DRAFT_530825 [Aspergillus sclerotioniger CBS 115572]